MTIGELIQKLSQMDPSKKVEVAITDLATSIYWEREDIEVVECEDKVSILTNIMD